MAEIEVTVENLLAQLIFLSFFASCILLIAWQKAFFTYPNPTEQTYRFSFTPVIGAFFTFLVMVLLVGPLLFFAWYSFKQGHLVQSIPRPMDSLSEGMINIISILCSAGGLALYYRFCSERIQQAVWRGHEKLSIKRDLLMGILTWLIAYPAVSAVGKAIELIAFWKFDFIAKEQIAVQYLRMTQDHPVIFTMMAVLIVFVVPVVEELLFRGFLQSWLIGKVSRGKAIVITSVIFAFFHFSSAQGFGNVELLASLFVLSCFLGFIYERQQSLWASVALHGIFNGVSVIAIAAGISAID